MKKKTEGQIWFDGFKEAEKWYLQGFKSTGNHWDTIELSHDVGGHASYQQKPGFDNFFIGMKHYIKYHEETLSQILNRKETQL